jgi:hypothetical protein
MNPRPVVGWPLWYGWSPVGREGSSREQIIVSSERISGSGQLLEPILRYLRYAPGDASGFAEVGSFGLVYRRTDTGIDDAGRSGAFFVDALLFPDRLPVEHLLQVRDRLDRTAPPATAADLPPSLSDVVFDGPDRIDPDEDDWLAGGEALRALSKTVPVRIGGRDGERAWRVLALLARLLPGPPIAGGVGEPSNRESLFDVIVPGADRRPARTDHQNRAARGDDGGDRDAWVQAARLLFDPAPTHDVQAILDALRAVGPERQKFCAWLGRWAKLERAARGGGALDEYWRTFLMSRPELLVPLVRRGGWPAVLDLVPLDSPHYPAVLQACPPDVHRDRFRRAIAELSLEQQLSRIDGSPLGRSDRDTLLDQVIESAQAEALRALPAYRKAEVLRRWGAGSDRSSVRVLREWVVDDFVRRHEAGGAAWRDDGRGHWRDDHEARWQDDRLDHRPGDGRLDRRLDDSRDWREDDRRDRRKAQGRRDRSPKDQERKGRIRKDEIRGGRGDERRGDRKEKPRDHRKGDRDAVQHDEGWPHSPTASAPSPVSRPLSLAPAVVGADNDERADARDRIMGYVAIGVAALTMVLVVVVAVLAFARATGDTPDPREQITETRSHPPARSTTSPTRPARGPVSAERQVDDEVDAPERRVGALP